MKNIRWDALYLGFMLSYLGNMNFMNWRFYAILIPFGVLNVLINNREK